MCSNVRKPFIIMLIVLGCLGLLFVGGILYVKWQLEKAPVSRDTVAYWRDDAGVQILRDQDDTFLEMTKDGKNQIVEVKIYYYRFIEPKLYVINKWGRYTVIDTEMLEIIAQTEDIDVLPAEDQNIFRELNQFSDISYRDDYPKRVAIEFGDGTIYLSVDKDSMFLCSEKSIYGDEFEWPKENILCYKQKGDKLYLIGEESSCMVVDLQSYELVVNGRISDLSEEYKEEFEEKEGFIDRAEALESLSK
jgi:hypothetical protein